MTPGLVSRNVTRKDDFVDSRFTRKTAELGGAFNSRKISHQLDAKINQRSTLTKNDFGMQVTWDDKL